MTTLKWVNHSFKYTSAIQKYITVSKSRNRQKKNEIKYYSKKLFASKKSRLLLKHFWL